MKRSQNPSSRRKLTLAAFSALALAGTFSAKAQVYTYNPTTAGGTDLWSTGAGWTPGAPVSGTNTELNFAATTTANGIYTSDNNNTAGTGAVFGGFALNILDLAGTGGANAQTINITASGGLPLEFSANGAVAPVINLTGVKGTGTLTYNVSSAIALDATTTVQGSGTAAFTLSGQIAGTGGLIKNGTSALTLSNASNSFSGGITLNTGTLTVSNDGAFGNANNAITLNGGTLAIGNGSATTGSGRTVTLGASGALITGTTAFGFNNFNASITGGFSLNLAGTSGNILVLNGTNSWTGGTNITGGAGTVVGFAGANSLPSSGVVTITNGGTLVALTNTSFPTVSSYLSSGRLSTSSTGVLAINIATGTSSETLDFSSYPNLSLGASPAATTSGGTLTFTGTITPANATYKIGGGVGAGGNLIKLGRDNILTGSNSAIFNSNGGSNIVLGNTNNYTGGTTVAGSSTTVFQQNAGALGSGPVTINSGNALQLQVSGGVTLANNFTLNSSGQNSAGGLVATTGANVLNGTVSGSGFIITASNTAGVTLTLNGNIVNTGTGSAGFLTGLTNGGDIVVNGNIGTSSTGGFQRYATGGTSTRTLTLNGINTFTGATTLSTGNTIASATTGSTTLAFQNSIVALSSTAGSGTLAFGPNITTAVMGGLSGNGNLSLLNTNATPAGVEVRLGYAQISTTNSTYTGVLSGAGASLTKVGLGTQVLGASNTYTGNTAVNGGGLTLDFNQGLTTSNILPATALTLGGGTVTLNGKSAATLTQSFSGVTLNPGASVFTSAQNSATSLTGTLNGITRNAGGTLDFTTLPTAGGVTTTTANANFTGGQQTILGGYATVGGTGWAVSGSGATAGTISTLAVYAPTTTTAGYAANGDVDVNTTNGANTVTASNINSLRFNTGYSTNAVQTLSAPLVIATGGILDTINVGTRTVTFNGGSLTSGNGQDLVVIQNDTGAAMTINSAITDNGGTSIGFTKSGAGALVLGGTNTYTGQTYLNAGTTTITSNANLGAVTTGATLNLNGGTLNLGGTANSVALDNGGANVRAVTLGGNGGSFNVASGNTLTINGVISGAIGTGGLTQATGTGTLALTGANTYTATTTVNAGTLLVNNTGSATSGTGTGTVVVNNTGILGGTGFINTSGVPAGNGVTINGGGRLTPGVNGAGMLTLTSNLALVGTGTTATTISTLALTVTGNTGSSLLVNGNVNLGTTFDQLLLTISGTQTATVIPLVTYTGTLTGTFDTVTGTVPSGYLLQYNYFANSMNEIALVAVPEPATWVAGLMMLAAAAATRRRRISAWLSQRRAAGSAR